VFFQLSTPEKIHSTREIYIVAIAFISWL